MTEAERRAQVSVEGAVVGVGGTSIEGMNSRGLYEFGRPREIDPGDLNYAVELASKVRLQEDRLVLQVVPQDFTLDGRAGYRNPRGVVCARLEANVHVISTSVHEHQALVNAVHHAHLAVEETIFEPVAAAYSAVLLMSAPGSRRGGHRSAFDGRGGLRRRRVVARAAAYRSRRITSRAMSLSV